jgi:hypothetical protein
MASLESLGQLPVELRHLLEFSLGALGEVRSLPELTIASWPTSVVRYYLVDYDHGDDVNVGYVDHTPTATDWSSSAVKTLLRASQIVPRLGAQRAVKILIKPRAGGAAYLSPDGTVDNLDLGYSMYRYVCARGTTDGTDSATDRIRCGFITAIPGPNADGSWTVTAGATASTVSVASGTISSEPSAVLYRVRFVGNVTAALANQVRAVWASTSTSLTFCEDTSTPAANGDQFFIEGPGVQVSKILLNGCVVGGTNTGGATIAAGIYSNFTGTQFWNHSGGTFHLNACRIGGLFQMISRGAQFRTSSTMIEADGTTVPTSLGVRFEATSGFSTFAAATCVMTNSGTVAPGHTIQCTGCQEIQPRWGTYFAGGLQIVMSGRGGPSSLSNLIGNFSSATQRPMRIVGPIGGTAGLNIIDSDVNIRGVVITGMGSLPGINISTGSNVTIDDISGSTGNTGYGVDLTTAGNANVRAGRLTANTVTGALGDIALPGPVVLTHTGLTITNVVDTEGNQLIGTGKKTVDTCVRVTNKAGGALIIGDVVRSNGTSGQVTKAQASSDPNAAFLGVMVTPPANNADGYMAVTGLAWANFDGTPTAGAIAYVSPTGAGQLTTTPPGSSKMAVGRVISVSGSTGLVRLSPDNLVV